MRFENYGVDEPTTKAMEPEPDGRIEPIFLIDNDGDKMITISANDLLDTIEISLNDDILKSQYDESPGRKYDFGKLEYGLIPPLELREMVAVLTKGAQKYERDNWQLVPDSKRRYFDALQRHLWDWKAGEQNDPETGLHHLAHALCNLMFLYEHDVKYSVDK